VSRVASCPTSSCRCPRACTTSQPGEGGPSQHAGVQGRRRHSGGQVCSRGAGAAEDMQAARRSEVLFAADTRRVRAPRASKSASREVVEAGIVLQGGSWISPQKARLRGASTHQRKSRIQGVLARPTGLDGPCKYGSGQGKHTPRPNSQTSVADASRSSPPPTCALSFIHHTRRRCVRTADTSAHARHTYRAARVMVLSSTARPFR
jgi:hypothetical protein